MLQLMDQLGNNLHLKSRPLRIISLVPSQSEFLWSIGLKEELVGITKFCIHPKEMFENITRVGGTKALDFETIRHLKPDLIIGNKEENEERQIKLLQKEFKVWMSDIYNFDDAFEMMQQVGAMLGKSIETGLLVTKIKESVNELKNYFHNQKVLYFIWNNPYMCAATNTFIDFVLNHIGLNNAAKTFTRYPTLSPQQIKELNPEFCFLSSEPFPFKEKHMAALQKILPEAKIVLVDGELFSWYGSRLLHLEAYVRKLKKEIEGN